MAAVVLKDICKNYDGGVKAVNNVNLEIKDREFMVLAGPSGCGKGYESIPIVAVTADVVSSENFDTGCFTCVITKPVTAGKLQNVLESMNQMP